MTARHRSHSARRALVAAALACWPPERRWRARMRNEIDEWATDRFWRRAATVTRTEAALVAAANANRRAAMRAALTRTPQP